MITVKSYSGIQTSHWKRIIVSIADALASGATFYFTIYFVTVLHFSIVFSGVLLSFFGLGTMIGSFLSGKLSDKYSPGKISIFCLFVHAGMFFILIDVQSTFLLISMMLLIGLVNYGFKTSNIVWLLRSNVSDGQKNLQIINIVRSAYNVGVGSAIILVIMVSGFGYRYVFYVVAFLLLLSALFLLIQERNDKFVFPDKKSFNKFPDEDKKITEHPWMILFFLFLIGMIFSQLRVAYPIYVKHLFPHMGTNAFSILLLLNILIVVFTQTPIVGQLYCYNKIVLFGVGCFLSGLGMFILTFATSFYIAIISCVVLTLGEMIFYAMAQLICYQFSGVHRKGRSMGVYQMTLALSMIVGPAAGGFIYYHFGGNTLWYLTMVIGAFGLLVCLFNKNIYSRGSV